MPPTTITSLKKNHNFQYPESGFLDINDICLHRINIFLFSIMLDLIIVGHRVWSLSKADIKLFYETTWLARNKGMHS